MQDAAKCIICERDANATEASARTHIECPACGTFVISDEFRCDMPHHTKLHTCRARVIIGHWLRRSQAANQVPVLNNIEKLEELVDQDWLPPHSTQANNLVRYIGDRSSLGDYADLNDDAVQLIVGIEQPIGVPFLARELARKGVCKSEEIFARLTLQGWDVYDQLKRGLSSGNKAFIAMPFNKSDLDNTILPIAKNAARSCGFRLDRVDDQPKPGIIDVQIRVAIQESRFLIVDLTYQNLGAYWEAGYAEGMGKPVIYTVRVDHDNEVHFDTAHLSRVIWRPDELDLAERQIKAMIRNELPDAVHEN